MPTWKLLKTTIGFIQFSFIFSLSYAQNCSIKGKVSDQISGDPISYATASITTAKDSSIMLGAITNEEGIFLIDNIRPGRYKLQISFIGYRTVIIDNILLQKGIRNIGNTKLQILTKNLEEVIVRSTKPSITYKVDRKIIDASGFPGADVAMDLLENVPSLQVSFDGQLTYRGEGTFKVFVNGHSVANGEAKLRQISVGKIEKIEIITNPSAKYDAEGTAGIIHVILKKNRLEGYAIKKNVKYSTRGSYEWLFSIDKKEKRSGWYLEGQYTLHYGSVFEMNKQRKLFGDNILYTSSMEEKHKVGEIFNYVEFGFNYDITDVDFIDFSLNINPFNKKNIRDIEISTKDKKIRNNIPFLEEDHFINSSRDIIFQSMGSTLTYKHAFNKKRTHLLSATVDFSTYIKPMKDQYMNIKTSDTKIERTGYKGTEKNEVILNGKINYTLPLTEKTNVETGLKINIDHIPKVNSISGTFDMKDNIIPFPSEPLHQEVDFVQDVYAGYVTYKNTWKRIEYQLGIRIEHTKRKSNYSFENKSGQQINIPEQNNFTDIFPGFHITYSFNEKHQLTGRDLCTKKPLFFFGKCFSINKIICIFISMSHYKNQNISQMSFVDVYVGRRTAKNVFFTQVNQIINWAPIEKELKKICRRGKKERGCKAYNPLILFKMQLISVWYNLSDVQTENMVNENLSAMRFCGLALEDSVPDHSTLSRFRTALTEKKSYDRLLRKINTQLKQRKLIVKNGKAKVDASLTESPFNPKGAPTYEIAVDRKEDERSKEETEKEKQYHRLKKMKQPGADHEARWVKKSRRIVYGFKKHIATDENGMALGVHTTTANEHDSRGLKGLIDKIPKRERKEVMADKGYKSRSNDEMLDRKGSKSRIMHKGYRNKPLTNRQRQYNKLISKSRYVVERTFGSMKRWFGSGVTRLKGKAKVHGLHVLEAIAYNLKRSPGLIWKLAK